MLFDEPAELLAPHTTQLLTASGSQRKKTDLPPTEVIVGRARHRRLDTDVPEPMLLLQLSCSFLPAPATTVEWARFRVKLLPRPANPDVIAIDVSPTSVQEAQESSLKLRIEPKVGFAFGDISLGAAEWEIQKQQQIPSLVAAGLQTDSVYWQMETTPQYPLAGARGFYMLTTLPDSVTGFAIESGVVADIVTPAGIFRAATRERRDDASLTQVLWE